MNTENYRVLHSQHPRGMQHATNGHKDCNTQRNTTATSRLKAAALKVLTRNNHHNTNATPEQKQCNKEVKHPNDLLHIARSIISKAIKGLPTTTNEVISSPLFTEEDLQLIAHNSYTGDALRLYIGSWLVNDKEHPTPIYKDYAVQLKN